MSSPAGRALRWIEGILDELSVKRQYVGGLAARAHGSTRPLADIDLYVPDPALPELAEAVADYLVRPPVPYQDEDWDLVFMRADYEGQAVEIAGAESARYRDHQSDQWREVVVNWDAGVPRAVEGVEVPVMPLEQLARYKEALGRDVDRWDLAEIGRSLGDRAHRSEWRRGPGRA